MYFQIRFDSIFVWLLTICKGHGKDIAIIHHVDNVKQGFTVATSGTRQFLWFVQYVCVDDKLVCYIWLTYGFFTSEISKKDVNLLLGNCWECWQVINLSWMDQAAVEKWMDTVILVGIADHGERTLLIYWWISQDPWLLP